MDKTQEYVYIVFCIRHTKNISNILHIHVKIKKNHWKMNSRKRRVWHGRIRTVLCGKDERIVSYLFLSLL